MKSSPLILGTAQLGMPYGIANRTGQPDQNTANSIIKEAWDNGIREFDTAQAYGVSEEVLGRALSDLGLSKKARVISKFHPDLDHLDRKAMSGALSGSLQRLGVPYLFCIMLHREEALSVWNKGLSNILNDFIIGGFAKKTGVSVYSPMKAIEALDTDGIDVVQIPSNMLDRRFERAGVFQLAAEKKKTVYIRSIFLQGLILINVDDIPGKMSFAEAVLNKLDALTVNLELTREELALGYIKNEFPDTKVIFGADTAEQVKENCLYWQREYPSALTDEVKKTFSDVDERILNPALWP